MINLCKKNYKNRKCIKSSDSKHLKYCYNVLSYNVCHVYRVNFLALLSEIKAKHFYLKKEKKLVCCILSADC